MSTWRSWDASPWEHMLSILYNLGKYKGRVLAKEFDYLKFAYLTVLGPLGDIVSILW